jgi:hypothetical protein
MLRAEPSRCSAHANCDSQRRFRRLQAHFRGTGKSRRRRTLQPSGISGIFDWSGRRDSNLRPLGPEIGSVRSHAPRGFAYADKLLISLPRRSRLFVALVARSVRKLPAVTAKRLQETIVRRCCVVCDRPPDTGRARSSAALGWAFCRPRPWPGCVVLAATRIGVLSQRRFRVPPPESRRGHDLRRGRARCPPHFTHFGPPPKRLQS